VRRVIFPTQRSNLLPNLHLAETNAYRRGQAVSSSFAAMTSLFSRPTAASTFDLAAALDRYLHDSDVLVRRWPDLECYRRVSDGIEGIRAACASRPRVSVPMIELLIAHAELIQWLWEAKRQPQPPEVVEAADRAHRDCVQRLLEAWRGGAVHWQP
jgi:hypothetical protein